MKKYLLLLILLCLIPILTYAKGVYYYAGSGAVTGGATEVTITATEDIQLDLSAPDTNRDALRLEVSTYSSQQERIALIKFDLSSIPGDATIDSVSLVLNQNDGGNGTDTIDVYRLLRNWVESQATWNSYSTGNAWSSAGAAFNNADRSSTLSASLSVTTSTGDKAWTSAQLVTDVQNIIDSVNANYGWVFVMNTITQLRYHAFRSAEYGEAGERPRITITYH